MIAGKTIIDILSWSDTKRGRWYKKISTEDMMKAKEIVKEFMKIKCSLASSGKNNAMFGISPNHSDETKTKMSKSKMGKKNPFFGKKHTEETRAKMRIDNTGKILSEETKVKISVATKGMNNPMYGQTGEKHPNWQGGISFEPYGFDFNDELKEQIRQRDGYICQACDKTQKELGRKLDAHHIDYDKTNNKSENLISLCRACHAKTNFNREDWIEYFRKIMEETLFGST